MLLESPSIEFLTCITRVTFLADQVQLLAFIMAIVQDFSLVQALLVSGAQGRAV